MASRISVGNNGEPDQVRARSFCGKVKVRAARQSPRGGRTDSIANSPCGTELMRPLAWCFPALSVPFRGATVMLCAVILLCWLGWPAPAGAAEAALTVDVPAGQSKVARLRSLPKDAAVQVAVTSGQPITIALVAQSELTRAGNAAQAVFKGTVEKTLAFAVRIPKADHYLVVLDNRAGAQPAPVTLSLKASAGQSPPAEPAATPSTPGGTADARAKAEKVEAFLEKLGMELRRVFMFEPFRFQVRRCGTATALATTGGIVICTEYARELQAKLGDRQKVNDALLFTIFHELGHILLGQWKSPVYQNEEVADEFATVLLVMLNQKERVGAIVDYFAANPSVSEAIAKTQRDDRHPLSVQRARNIRHWLNDAELVRRWQPMLVPHLNTPILEKILEHPPAWADVAATRQELAARAAAAR